MCFAGLAVQRMQKYSSNLAMQAKAPKQGCANRRPVGLSLHSMSLKHRLHLEGRVPIQVKHPKIDIVACQGSRQNGEAEPDSLVLLCVWV